VTFTLGCCGGSEAHLILLGLLDLGLRRRCVRKLSDLELQEDELGKSSLHVSDLERDGISVRYALSNYRLLLTP